MINPFQEINWKPDRAARQRFALSWVIGFPALGLGWLLLRFWWHGQWEWPVAGALALGGGAAGLVLWLLPGLALPAYWVWHGIACAIGLVIGNVLLMLFFYTLFTGTGVAARAFHWIRFRKRFDPAAASYWQDAEPKLEPAQYYQQF